MTQPLFSIARIYIVPKLQYKLFFIEIIFEIKNNSKFSNFFGTKMNLGQLNNIAWKHGDNPCCDETLVTLVEISQNLTIPFTTTCDL